MLRVHARSPKFSGNNIDSSILYFLKRVPPQRKTMVEHVWGYVDVFPNYPSCRTLVSLGSVLQVGI